MVDRVLSALGGSAILEYVEDHPREDTDMPEQSSTAAWKNLHLSVHRLSDGALATSLITRTWTGGVAWDRRLSPLTPISMETLAPVGVDPRLWAVHHAVSRLLERQSGWIC